MPWIRPSGAHAGNVSRRPGRVPSARPPVQVSPPTLLSSYRRVGGAAAVRGQAVVWRSSAESAGHGRDSSRHVVSVQRGVGQVRLPTEILRHVVWLVQGKSACVITFERNRGRDWRLTLHYFYTFQTLVPSVLDKPTFRWCFKELNVKLFVFKNNN